MTVALIVTGVILFLILDAYVIARVLRSHRADDDYAEIPVPGETTVPAGKLKLTYQESYDAPSTGDGDIDFGTPSALEVTVTSATGEQLEIKGPGFRGMGSSLSTSTPGNWSRAVIGTLEVPAGIYTITAGPELPGAVEPQILIRK
jgi:hypothetical protein